MKTPIPLFVFSGLLMLAPLCAADSASAGPSPAYPAAKEMEVLEHFLDLTDEDLDQMQKVIVRIRMMGPAERAALREEIAKFRRLPESQRRQLRQGWGALDADFQEAWRRMMLAVSPERRAEIQQQMQALPPEKKGVYRRQLLEEFLGQQQKK
jgi:hypothetical protein